MNLKLFVIMRKISNNKYVKYTENICFEVSNPKK